MRPPARQPRDGRYWGGFWPTTPPLPRAAASAAPVSAAPPQAATAAQVKQPSATTLKRRIANTSAGWVLVGTTPRSVEEDGGAAMSVRSSVRWRGANACPDQG